MHLFGHSDGTGWNPTTTVALEAVPFAALLAEPSGRVIAVNQRWVELTGLGEAASLGSGWLDAIDPEAGARIRSDIAAVHSLLSPMATDYQLLARDPGRWTRWWLSSHDYNGEPVVVIAVADVHEERTREAVLYHLATHDSLTGLLNRSHFLECTDQALRRKERHLTRVSVVFIDLDGFKRVNDLGGHALGNRVLVAVGARLRNTVRGADLVARIGGDEFAVLCEDLVDEEQSDYVVGRIAMSLAETVELDGESWPVAASVGSALDLGNSDTAEALLDRADRAMYRVKAGRHGSEPEYPRYETPYETPIESATDYLTEPEPSSATPEPPAAEREPTPLDSFVADLRDLRDSFHAIRSSLDRLAASEPTVIDVRDELRNKI